MSNIKIRYNIENQEQVKKTYDVLMVWFENNRAAVEAAMNNNNIVQTNGDTWELELKKKVDVHRNWTELEGSWIVRGHTVSYIDKVYRIIQSHTATAGSEPDISMSLFRPVPVVHPGEPYPRWDSIGTLDSENNWDTGDRVMWNGEEWQSDIDNNIFEPGVSSWTIISVTPVDCIGISEWDPNQAWNTYTVGDKRTNNGSLYELHTQAWAQSEPSGASGHLGWTYLGDC